MCLQNRQIHSKTTLTETLKHRLIVYNHDRNTMPIGGTRSFTKFKNWEKFVGANMLICLFHYQCQIIFNYNLLNSFRIMSIIFTCIEKCLFWKDVHIGRIKNDFGCGFRSLGTSHRSSMSWSCQISNKCWPSTTSHQSSQEEFCGVVTTL